jgi:hypothetical protein
MFKTTIVFLALFLSFSLSHSQEAAPAGEKKINVGVMDLKTEGEIKSASNILSDRLRAELFNTGKFQVMERGEMDAILKEQGFQQSGSCDDKACMVEVGQLLGVDRMVAGSLGQLGSLYLINLRIINVKTGQLMDTYSGECRCPVEELGGAMKTAAQVLAGGKPAPAEQQAPAPQPQPQSPAAKAEAPQPEARGNAEAQGRGLIIDFSMQGINPEYNQALRTLESKPGNRLSAQGAKAEFRNLMGFDINFKREVGNYLAFKIGAGFQSTSTSGDYRIVDSLALFSGPADNNMTVNSSLALLPAMLGLRLQTAPARFRAHLGGDLVLNRVAFESSVSGTYTYDSSAIRQTRPVDGKLTLSKMSVGFVSSLGAVLKLGQHFGLGADFTYTKMVLAKETYTGNMTAFDRAISRDFSTPSDNGDHDYKFVKFDPDLIRGNDDYGFIRKDSSPFFSRSTETDVNLSGPGFKFYTEFYF